MTARMDSYRGRHVSPVKSTSSFLTERGVDPESCDAISAADASICYRGVSSSPTVLHMPSQRFVLVLTILVGLSLAAASDLRAQPAACLAAAELVNTPDFEASPRPDETAELLALWYTDGLVADGALYWQIHTDLARAGQQFPELDLWPAFRGREIPSDVLVEFVDEAARDAAANGENAAFNCLIELLGARSVRYIFNWAGIEFHGLYDVPVVRSLFEMIPEVELTTPNMFLSNFDTGCFHSPDGFSRVYFLEEVRRFPFPRGVGNVERIEFSADGTVSYEKFDRRTIAPWRSELEACLDRQLSGELVRGLPTVREIPSLSDFGLSLLVLMLLAAGVVRLRPVL